MKSVLVFLIVAFACVPAGPVLAGDGGPIDLGSLLDEVDRASPQLLAVRARAEAAGLVAPQREAFPDPKLSIAYTNDGLSSFTLGSTELSNLTAAWEQDVPASGVRDSAVAVAQAQAGSMRAASDTLRARLRARIIALYAQLWRLDRTTELLAESRALLATSAETARVRYESGEGIQEGLIRAQTAVRRTDIELEELALVRRRLEIALGAAVGRAGNPAFGPAVALPLVTGPVDEDDLVAAAVSSSPEVLETLALERTAEAELNDARVQVKPMYSWVAAYQYRGKLEPMVMGGFSVRLPVYKDRKQERAIAAAAIERTAAGHDREEAELRARAGVRELAADVSSIDVRLRLYREAIVPQSAAALDAAEAALASGRAEMSLVLDDLDRFIAARREELTLSAQRIEAVAELEALTGMELLEIQNVGRAQ